VDFNIQNHTIQNQKSESSKYLSISSDLTEEQLKRFELLQNPNIMFDNMGNEIQDSVEIKNYERNNKMTYFILKRWPMPVRKYIQILMVILFMAFFFERYCFAVMIYKNKNYGAVLIILIIFFNAIFMFVIQRLRRNKQRKRLHEIFNIEQAPKVGFCEIFMVG
jgi:magnesium-transporting ATPase (P-type)